MGCDRKNCTFIYFWLLGDGAIVKFSREDENKVALDDRDCAACPHKDEVRAQQVYFTTLKKWRILLLCTRARTQNNECFQSTDRRKISRKHNQTNTS